VALIRWWHGLWTRTEHPGALAGVRVLLAAVILVDLLLAGHLDLVVGLWGDADAGGMLDVVGRKRVPESYQWLPPSPGTAWTLWGVAVGSAAALLVGLGTRIAAVVLCLSLAQMALVLPAADRGIDMLLRNALLVLACSHAGATASLWARIRTGRFLGVVGGAAPAWPRYLLIVQLVLLYWGAGSAKVSSTWTPLGDYAALYVAMRDPHFARLSAETVAGLYPLTQVLTATTWLWEWSAPLLLLAYHYRDTRTKPGRMRALFNRMGFVQRYLALGVVFHVGTHLTMRLGIFPFAVLALYPAALHPDEWARGGRALLRGVRGAVPPWATAPGRSG